ncbi:MAG: hypothetical protein ACOCYE_12380 [Pseudomonadota bacterium]
MPIGETDAAVDRLRADRPEQPLEDNGRAVGNEQQREEFEDRKDVDGL